MVNNNDDSMFNGYGIPTVNTIENTRFVFLDWLRIVAFLSVFIEHKYTANIMDLAHDPHTHNTFYLFHNWLYDKFVNFISAFSSNTVSHFISVILLFCSCWFVTLMIERPAIKLGRALALKYSV